jgi:hypothetical protein
VIFDPDGCLTPEMLNQPKTIYMPIATVENKEEWKLSSLNIQHYSWEKESPYRGKIVFTNKNEDALSFNIPEDKMMQLLSLIADNVVDSATRLGHRIAESVTSTLRPPQLAAPAIETVEEIHEPAQQKDTSGLPF